MPSPPWPRMFGRPLDFLRSHRHASLLLALLLVVAGVSGTTLAIQNQGGEDIHTVDTAATGDHTVTFKNDTGDRVWVGSEVNQDGSQPLGNLPTLDPGKSATITVPEHEGAGHWRGTFFARQGCSGNSGSDFKCAVGDCGPYADHCQLGQQPTSLAEFNFDPANNLAPWYDVSYVDAVSTAVTISPDDVQAPPGGTCAQAGCPEDLLSGCPQDNLVKGSGDKPLVCVNPNRDAQTPYSDAINKKCPTAYAWSKQDAAGGAPVVYQCTKCKGLTVTFHQKHAQQDVVKSVQPPAAHKPAKHKAPQPKVVKSPQRTSGAKGVSLNPVDGAGQALADSGASWYFNWASSTGPVSKPKGVDYVPMIWGAGSVTDSELNHAKAEGKELLGFNEPDSASQANMTPQQALDLWPKLQSTGLKMGAPAVSYGADTPGGWLDQFMRGAAQRHLRVDFIPLHWYGGDFGPDAANQLRGYLKAVHDRYHKPIWLTEYGLTDFAGPTPRYPSGQQQVDFINSSTKMLKSLDYVNRYAWFTLSTQTSPTGLYNGATPNASGKAYKSAG